MAVKKTLKEIASLVGGSVIGDESVEIKGIAPIEDAASTDITFFSNSKYFRFLSSTKAGAVIVKQGTIAVKGKNFVIVKDPQIAFARLLKEFLPDILPLAGIHPNACIHPSATVGKDASVGPYAVIEQGSTIGQGVVLYPGVYVGGNVTIGDGSIIYSNVSIREGSRLGKRVIVHSNSVIGSDGFGYAKENGKITKIPQRGNVVIGDDVEIGACVAIDRATIGSTVIERGVKIDNLVQIAHNVKIGEDSIIVAQTGISGSTKIGRRVTLAGQVGVAGHIEITDDVTVGAKSGVTNDIKTKGVFTGYPAVPHNEWLKAMAVFSKLPEMNKRLRDIEKGLKELLEAGGEPMRSMGRPAPKLSKKE